MKIVGRKILQVDGKEIKFGSEEELLHGISQGYGEE